MTIVVGALAWAVPSVSRADVPDAASHVTGMSELPARVQDGVEREAQRTSSGIRELRASPDGHYRAELSKGDRGGEVVTFDRAGRIIDRQAY